MRCRVEEQRQKPKAVSIDAPAAIEEHEVRYKPYSEMLREKKE